MPVSIIVHLSLFSLFFLVSPDLGAYLGFRIRNLESLLIFLLMFSHTDSSLEAVSWGAASGADEHGH